MMSKSKLLFCLFSLSMLSAFVSQEIGTPSAKPKPGISSFPVLSKNSVPSVTVTVTSTLTPSPSATVTVAMPAEVQMKFNSLGLKVCGVDEGGVYHFGEDESITYRETDGGGKWMIEQVGGGVLEVGLDDLIRSSETGNLMFLDRGSFDGKRVNVQHQVDGNWQTMNIEVGFPEDPSKCNVLPEGVGMEPILLAEKVFVEDIALEGDFEIDLPDYVESGLDMRIIFGWDAMKLVSCLGRSDGSVLARFVVDQPESEDKVAFLNVRIPAETGSINDPIIPSEWLAMWKEIIILPILVDMTVGYAEDSARMDDWQAIQDDRDLVNDIKHFIDTGVVLPALEDKEMVIDRRQGFIFTGEE